MDRGRDQRRALDMTHRLERQHGPAVAPQPKGMKFMRVATTWPCGNMKSN